MVLWLFGPLVLWSSGPVVLWSSGPVVLWSCGRVVLWSSGPKILWTASESRSMFCECIWGGGAAPSPPTPLQPGSGWVLKFLFQGIKFFFQGLVGVKPLNLFSRGCKFFLQGLPRLTQANLRWKRFGFQVPKSCLDQVILLHRIYPTSRVKSKRHRYRTDISSGGGWNNPRLTCHYKAQGSTRAMVMSYTPRKINMEHVLMEVWFRSFSFLFMGDL